MNRIIRTAGAVLLAGNLAHAQAPARKIKFRTLCLEHVGDIKQVQLVAPDGKTGIPLDLFTSVISKEVEATVTGDQLNFGIPGKDAKGADGFKPVATAKALASNRQLALFLPGQPGGTPYSVVMVDDNEATWPMGSTRLYNLAPTPVRFDIGENSKVVAPGKSDIVPQAKKVNALNQCPVVISFADKAGKLIPVNSTLWLSTDQQRSLAISFIHPITKQPTVNSFPETPPWRLPKLD